MTITREDLKHFADERGFEARRSGQAIEFRGSIGKGFVAVFTVPDDVTEWFLTVERGEDGKKVFSDWADHFEAMDGPDTPEQRDLEMLEAVRTTMQALADISDCRVRRTDGVSFLGRKWFRSTELEVEHGGGWTELWDFVFPDDGDD